MNWGLLVPSKCVGPGAAAHHHLHCNTVTNFSCFFFCIYNNVAFNFLTLHLILSISFDIVRFLFVSVFCAVITCEFFHLLHFWDLSEVHSTDIRHFPQHVKAAAPPVCGVRFQCWLLHESILFYLL